MFCLPFLTARATRVVAVAAVLVAYSSLGLQGQGSYPGPQGSNRVRRAHLSADLTRHEARRTTARERVIVHGTDRELALLASRHRLKVVKRMRGAAVVLANSAELSDSVARRRRSIICPAICACTARRRSRTRRRRRIRRAPETRCWSGCSASREWTGRASASRSSIPASRRTRRSRNASSRT